MSLPIRTFKNAYRSAAIITTSFTSPRSLAAACSFSNNHSILSTSPVLELILPVDNLTVPVGIFFVTPLSSGSASSAAFITTSKYAFCSSPVMIKLLFG